LQGYWLSLAAGAFFTALIVSQSVVTDMPPAVQNGWLDKYD